MSKERLEEIESRVWKDKGTYVMGEENQREGYIYTLSDYDFEWLIQQAERVQELEQQNKRYQDMLVKIFKIVQNHQIMKISDEDYTDAAIFLYKWIYDTGAIDHQKHFSELHGHDEFDSYQISLLLKRHLEETKWF